MRKPTTKNRKFEEFIRNSVEAGSFSPEEPLPPTRDLAEEHGLSSSTVYRILLQLKDKKLLTQESNGRFFPANSRPATEKPQPFACLLPTVRLWSTALRAIMDGVSRRSSHYKRGTLLVHCDLLIEQKDVNTPPEYASQDLQYKILEDYYHTHEESCEGVILDNIWDDEVIERFHNKLKRIVIVNRHTRLDFASCVHPDFQLCSALAISHLLAKGYEKLLFVSAYEDYYVRQWKDAILSTAKQINSPLGEENFVFTPDRKAQEKLVKDLKRSSKRTGIYTPEDNWARLLLGELKEQGVNCPGKVGLLAGTGTRSAEEAEMSSLRIDFQKMGSLAVDLLRQDEPTNRSVGVELIARKTT